nr:ORF2 [Raccoon dog Torque teno virus 2]
MSECPKKRPRWSKDQDLRAKHEAIWKKSCSRTHQLWCSCGDWVSHLRGVVFSPGKTPKTPWPTPTREGTGGDPMEEEPTVRFDVVGDLEMLAAAAAGEGPSGEDAEG